jgi:hypothetical protein
MTLTRVFAAAVLTIVCASVPCPRAAASMPAAPVDAARLCAPGDVCKNGHPDYYWTLEDWFSGSESFSVLCDETQRGVCEGGWKPVSVTMYLYWEEENDCALTVQAEIHEADPGNPERSARGRLVAASEVKTVGPFRPAGLWAITVPMPHDAPTVTGPCFATIRFLDGCSDLPAMVAAPGECEAMHSWTDRGDGWTDMRDLELPGNLSAYATFECQLTDDADPVAWSTIKSMYGTDE